MTNNKNDKSAWIIGGSMLIGLGVGYFLLTRRAEYHGHARG